MKQLSEKSKLPLIAISACLCGQKVRYDGGHCKMVDLPEYVVTVCPEQLGGLSTPRAAAELVGGDGYDVWQGRARVIDAQGREVTAAFKLGAIKTLKCLQDAHIETVWLKSKSPSCGVGRIYDGSFSGQMRSGDGVTTAWLKLHGIQVISCS